MPLPFEQTLIVSDLDGTLIAPGFFIPQRNLDAIARFCRLGGRFALATGRAIDSARRYAGIVHPNAPSIVLNGSMIYEYSTGRILWDHPLPECAGEYITRFHRAFPQVGVEVCTEQGIHMISQNSRVLRHVEHEGLSYRFCPLEEVRGKWYKTFFALDDPALMPEMQRFAEEEAHPGVRYVPSCEYYFEMLPSEADKGRALRKLAAILEIPLENTYAVGDYYNDLELLHTAGTAVVPANAPKEIRAQADLLVCGCENGALADLVEYLEQRNGSGQSPHF